MTKLVFGIVEGKYSFKPLLFDAELLRADDLDKLLIRQIGKEKRSIRRTSSVFVMDDIELINLMNHYGIDKVYKIIGARICEDKWYETEIRN